MLDETLQTETTVVNPFLKNKCSSQTDQTDGKRVHSLHE